MSFGIRLFIGIITGCFSPCVWATTHPSLRVDCNVLVPQVTITCHLDTGDKTVTLRKAAITLKSDQYYTLLVSKEGYVPVQKTFIVNWDGLKEKRVELEEGIAPCSSKSWLVDLDNSIYMEFLPIPVGQFMMGSDDSEIDEQPAHRVSFSRSFWMAKTEVTQQQYGQYAEVPKTDKRKDVPMPSGAEQPVTGVSWTDAIGFCQWLTTKERGEGNLPEGYEYTLPTEAEWEYACRAGSEGDFSGELVRMGWYNKNSSEKTHPVASKKGNAWGLYDMHGNVWEWCADYWYANYKNAPSNGAQRGLSLTEFEVDRSEYGKGPYIYRFVNKEYRVVRGGSWHYSAQECRSANRYYHKPAFKLNYLGFRPVLVWNPPYLNLQVTNHIKEN